MSDPSSVLVQIWPLAVSQRRLETLRTHLSPDEREKADRIRTPAIAQDFVAVRGTTRELLAIQCGCEPGDLKFAIGPQGKPFLASPSRPVTFNLTHSGGYCALATTRAARIGVDIEMIRPTVGDLAESVFTPREAAQYASIIDDTERMRAFFRAWVAKEAYLKAMGEGLAGGLKTLEVDLTMGAEVRAVTIRNDPSAVRNWRFEGFDISQTIVGAVVVEARGDAATIVIHLINAELNAQSD